MKKNWRMSPGVVLTITSGEEKSLTRFCDQVIIPDHAVTTLYILFWCLVTDHATIYNIDHSNHTTRDTQEKNYWITRNINILISHTTKSHQELQFTDIHINVARSMKKREFHVIARLSASVEATTDRMTTENGNKVW